MQHGNDMRQQVRPNGGDQTNMQWTRHGLSLLARHLFKYFDFAQHGSCLLDQ